MDHASLPYLQCLRETFSNLSVTLAADPAATVPCDVAGTLLDYMLVERAVAPEFRATFHSGLLAALTEIESVLGADSKPVEAAIAEIRNIAAVDETAAFGRLLTVAGTIQRALLARGSPAATAICKTITRLEADYNQKFDAALIAQTASSKAAAKAPTIIRNVRDIDESALLDFIRNNYPDETELGIASSGFIPGGYSKFTALIGLTGARSIPAEIVMRGDGAATFGGASVVDEYWLIKSLYDNGVCVPRPLAMDDSGKVFGSPMLLVEKRPGISIGNMFEVPKQPNVALLRDVATRLAELHRVPLVAMGPRVDSLDKQSSEKVLAWLEEGHRAWLPLNMPSTIFETAFDWLRRNAGINDKSPRTVVHGDFGLNNLLVENDRVTAILDWEFAHAGNPAYDLGYFYFMALSLGPWDEFLDAYGATGMPIPDEEQINYAILFAATRLSVMVCQTYAVFTTGAEPSLASARNIGGGYYEESVRRIAFALDKVF